MVACMVPGGGDLAKGSGWPWVLSDLKSLLETGAHMPTWPNSQGGGDPAQARVLPRPVGNDYRQRR